MRHEKGTPYRHPVFRRRTETVVDVAVLAINAFMVLDRGVDAWALDLARRALADIAITGAKVAGMDFSPIGAPGVLGRLRPFISSFAVRTN